MKNILMKNLLLLASCFIFVSINYAISGNSYVSNSIEDFLKFFTFPLVLLVSAFQCYLNIIFLKRNSGGKKVLPTLFLIFSILVFFYSSLITIGLFAFRNFGSL